MVVLCVESSATVASSAVIENDKVLSEVFLNVGLTHSQTLMSTILTALRNANKSIDEIDLIAVTNGPGSFTGIRIGISSVKGLAFTNNIPCCAVSTLESLAFNIPFFDGIICPVMDARCNQVYTAFFEKNNNKLVRLSEDEAISIENLEKKLKILNKNVIFVGDGAKICYNFLSKSNLNLYLPSENLLFQRASSAGFCAISSGIKTSHDKLLPLYLRLPQAQRELNDKLKLNNKAVEK